MIWSVKTPRHGRLAKGFRRDASREAAKPQSRVPYGSFGEKGTASAMRTHVVQVTPLVGDASSVPKLHSCSTWRPSFLRFIFLTMAFVSFLLAVPSLQAQLFWDNNGATAGFGTANGTWADPTTNDSTQGWSTSSNGTSAISGTTTTNSTAALNFGTDSASLANGNITVSGTVNANTLTFGNASGNIGFVAGTINLGTSPMITVTRSNGVVTISSTLAGSNGFTKNGSGQLTLSGSNEISSVAWYYDNTFPNGPKVVATKLPNELGLYDMSGGVAEWCWDVVVGQSSRRVRGGSWGESANASAILALSSASRSDNSIYRGFRPVKNIPSI